MLKVPTAIEVGAVIIGALSGAIHAVGRKADAIGTFTIALATGVGGGILRDVLIGDGAPLALRVPLYLPAVAIVSLAALLFANGLARVTRALVVIDALLIGFWTVMGAERAFAHALPATAAVFLGTVTATGGGVLRDLLSGETPTLFRKGELYVTAAFLAALVYVALLRFVRAPLPIAELATIGFGTSLRLLAMRWHLTAPEPFDLPGWWRRRRRTPQ